MKSNLAMSVVKHSTHVEGQTEYTLSISLDGKTHGMTFFSTDSTQSVLMELQVFIDSFDDEIIDK